MKRQEIREKYKKMKDKIKSYYPKTEPYFMNFKMTLIEKNVWSDIRCLGLPMYLQYPVLGYFLDFADPIMKIGIEVDGKEWHTDLEKDRLRQKEIEEQGWIIYRISGRQTFKGQEDYFHENTGLLDKSYYRECSEGILQNIKRLHY